MCTIDVSDGTLMYYSPPALWGYRSVRRSPGPPEPETRSFPPGPVPSHHAPQWTWCRRGRGQRSVNQSEKLHTDTQIRALDTRVMLVRGNIQWQHTHTSIRCEWAKGQGSAGEGLWWNRRGRCVGEGGGVKGQRSAWYLLSVIRPLGRLQALQTETHCCYCF